VLLERNSVIADQRSRKTTTASSRISRIQNRFHGSHRSAFTAPLPTSPDDLSLGSSRNFGMARSRSERRATSN